MVIALKVDDKLGENLAAIRRGAVRWRFDAIEDDAVYSMLTVAAIKRGRPYADRVSFWRSYSRCRLAFVGAFELSLRWGYEPTELPKLIVANGGIQ